MDNANKKSEELVNIGVWGKGSVLFQGTKRIKYSFTKGMASTVSIQEIS